MILSGIGCSSGIVTGKAYCIDLLDDTTDIPLDAILIVKKSSPQWVVPLMHSRGIVCEIGGRMSHLAILCRELDKPCVSGIERAFSIIKTNDSITIDGERGKVIINE